MDGPPKQPVIGAIAIPSTGPAQAAPERVRAPGFPVAPLVEVVFAASFGDGLDPDQRHSVAAGASVAYPTTRLEKHHGIKFDLDGDEISIGEPETTYRLEGTDGTELLLVRPDGIATCQLAPYKSWNSLLDRFSRDLMLVWERHPDKRVSRLAVRSINRIDVPLVNGLANFEDYLALHIQVPSVVPSIGPFQLQLTIPIPEAKAFATVRSGLTDPAVEDKASFILDIDLARVEDIPESPEGVFKVFNELHDPKNRLYKGFLTPKALEEFE